MTWIGSKNHSEKNDKKMKNTIKYQKQNPNFTFEQKTTDEKANFFPITDFFHFRLLLEWNISFVHFFCRPLPIAAWTKLIASIGLQTSEHIQTSNMKTSEQILKTAPRYNSISLNCKNQEKFNSGPRVCLSIKVYVTINLLRIVKNSVPIQLKFSELLKNHEKTYYNSSYHFALPDLSLRAFQLWNSKFQEQQFNWVLKLCISGKF